MLAYLDDMPILGAPGCARSRKISIVDWVLPRLLAGDRLTRADIVSPAMAAVEDAPNDRCLETIRLTDRAVHLAIHHPFTVPADVINCVETCHTAGR
jgi:molybdopterin biosynthesis enzyme